MASGGRDWILRALEELTESELRRLKDALNRWPGAGGYGTIPRGRMEKADALDLTQLLVGRYGESYGAEVTAQALRRIQRRDLAEGAPGGEGHAPSDITTAGPAPSPPALFVTRHRVALIERVASVAAILDRLLAAGVLTDEQVAAVGAGRTPQEKMRRLLATAPAWGGRGHRLFLDALRELHPYLVEELEGAP